MKIQALVALSGPIAVVGAAMQQGMDVAVQLVNESGGVLGKPLEISYVDNGGSADQSAAKLQELLSGGKPHAVIPGSASEIPAGIPILAQAGIFTSQHFTSATFNDPKKYPLAFGNAHTIPDYVGSLVDEAKKRGYKSIGILDIDDASGEAFEAVAKPSFGDGGISVTFARVPPDSIDATPQLQQVLAANPEALVFAGYSPAAGAMAKARTKLGVKLPFPINTYLVAYHDVVLAAAAANLAKSLDAEKMAKALEGAKAADMPLYVNPVTFSADNHFPTFGPDDFVFTTYGPVEKGLSVPST